MQYVAIPRKTYQDFLNSLREVVGSSDPKVIVEFAVKVGVMKAQTLYVDVPEDE